MATFKINVFNSGDSAYWHPIAIVGEYLEEDFLRAAAYLGVPSRLLSLMSDSMNIEVLCTGHSEVAKIEGAFRQSMADQRLRREIAKRANSRISEIVDTVIGRVSGG